jgi:hypothetical protein
VIAAPALPELVRVILHRSVPPDPEQLATLAKTCTEPVLEIVVEVVEVDCIPL